MILGPREVSPGYQQRWARETWELLTRAADVWLALAIAFSATGYLLHPVLGTGQALLGAYETYVVIHVARVAAQREVRFSDVAEALRLAGSRTVHLYQRAPKAAYWTLGVSTIAALFFDFGYLTGLRENPIAELLSFAPTNLAAWLFQRNSPLGCASYGVMWSITTGGTVYFALGVLFDLYDGDRLKDLVVRAIWINRRAVWFSLMAAYLGLLVGYVIPLFAPLAAIAFPVFSYVVTRDLFEHGDGNRKSVRKRAAGRQTSPQPA